MHTTAVRSTDIAPVDGSPASSAASLYHRLGGVTAVRAVVDEFYKRLLADVALQRYFEGISIPHLKRHQVEFMKIAFTEIPANLDVPALLLEKHRTLFSAGLNENHFDAVASHFVEACKQLGVQTKLIDEAVGVIGPLRSVFEHGAKTYGGSSADEA
jgi:hemoglobin